MHTRLALAFLVLSTGFSATQNQPKQAFPTALRQFVVALAGFGSDGSAIRSSIESMSSALADLDQALRDRPMSLVPERPGDMPTFAPAIYAAGVAALTRGAYAEAVDEFRRAAALDPLSADAGAASDALAEGRAALRRGDLPSALRYFTNGVQAAPDRGEAHRALATAYWADGQPDRSVEEFKAAIRANPRDERSRSALAEALATGGHFAEAEQVLKDAITIIPNSGQAHYNLGRLYEALAKYTESVRELEESARLNPIEGRDSLYEMIGTIYVAQADFDRAAQAQSKRIDADPRNVDAHRKLGEARFRQDRYDEALAAFVAATSLDPRSVGAYSAAAQIHLRLGRYAQAAQTARRALEIDPALKEARYALGTALMRLGEADEGAKELEEFRRLQAEAAAAARRQYERERIERDAAVSLANADYEKAVALLRQAVSYESTAAPTYLALGFALLEAGHHADAIVSLQKASQLEAGPDAHRYLAEAYRALGQPDASRAEADLYRQMIESLKKDRLRKMSGNP